MGGGEDVAVRVGGTDDEIHFAEAVFDFVEADELDAVLPFGVEIGAVAVIAPDCFFVDTRALFDEAFAEESGSDNHDGVYIFGFGGKVAKGDCFDLFGFELGAGFVLNFFGDEEGGGDPFLKHIACPAAVFGDFEGVFDLRGDVVFSGGLREHAGGDEAEMLKGFFSGLHVIFILFDGGESHAVRKNAVLGRFGGDDGDNFNSVAGVEEEEFMYAPELH